MANNIKSITTDFHNFKKLVLDKDICYDILLVYKHKLKFDIQSIMKDFHKYF